MFSVDFSNDEALTSSYRRLKSDSSIMDTYTAERKSRDKGYRRLSSPQQSYEDASYRVVDSMQREELENLLKKVIFHDVNVYTGSK